MINLRDLAQECEQYELKCLIAIVCNVVNHMRAPVRRSELR